MSGFSTAHEITITIDTGKLRSYTDSQLATAWHVAQANHAPHGDHAAGELVEHIAREIVRRWISTTAPELWKHQGRDHYWSELCRFAKWTGDEWVPRDSDDPPAEDLAVVADLDVPRTGA